MVGSKGLGVFAHILGFEVAKEVAKIAHLGQAAKHVSNCYIFGYAKSQVVKQVVKQVAK